MTKILMFVVGVVFGVNWIRLKGDIDYLLKGKEAYFEWYISIFRNPSETFIWHIIIAIGLLLAGCTLLFAD